MLKVSQYPRNADGNAMDLEVGVLTDTSGNGGARLTQNPVGPDGAPIDAKGLVLVRPDGSLATVVPIDDALDPADTSAVGVTRSASKIAALLTSLGNTLTASIGTAIAALGLGSASTHAINEFAVVMADRATMAAYVATNTAYFDGSFWDRVAGTNFSTQVTADPLKGIYVALSTDASGVSGAWVRRFNSVISAKWFAKGDSNATASVGTDDTAAIQAAINFINFLGGGALYFPEGFYKISAYLTASKNMHIIGAGRNAATIVATHAGGGGGSADLDLRNGSLFYSNWPSNATTQVNIVVEHLGMTCVNGANVGAGFYDNGGTFITINDCAIKDFKYPVVFDQTEVSDINGCILSTGVANGACVWLVNGAILKAGNITQFTNRIGVHRCQLGANAITVDCIRDDGGYTHVFADNNYNGGQYQIRMAGSLAFSIRGGEFEGATKNPLFFSLTSSDGVTATGISVGQMSGGIVVPGNQAGGFGSVQLGSTTVSFDGVAFTDTTTYPLNGIADSHVSINGCSTGRADAMYSATAGAEFYSESQPLMVKTLNASRAANFDDMNGINRAAAAFVLTINADATFQHCPIGAYIVIEQSTGTVGAGFAAGAGCTITGPLLTTVQNQWILAHKVAANTWVTRLITSFSGSASDLASGTLPQARLPDLSLGNMEFHVNVSGLFLTTQQIANATVVAGVADRYQVHPWTPSRDTTIQNIGVEVTTLLAASNAKVVVLDTSAATGGPGNVLFETGNLSCAAVGYVSEARAFTFLKGVTYWVGVRTSSTQSLRAYTSTSTRSIGQALGTGGPQNGLQQTLAFATAAGAWGAPTGAQMVAANLLAVVMQLA
jgi:hypothetical protein